MYRSGWFGFGIAVSVLALGALIDFLPPRHITVVVQGTLYYYDGSYYRQAPNGGYVVVTPPVFLATSGSISGNSNNKCSYMEVLG